ncbi:MAG TPA: hypothetical protein VHY18_11245 [Solirubrobacteraceae bacterium]|jgi:predicted amidohydrolase|nr:hypothetical protein [Solirubrobacteraceae bacterium]
MQGRTAHESANALADQLQQATRLTDAVAILWTWLEEQLDELGSLQLNMPAVCAAARKRPFVKLDTAEIERLRHEPLVGAAELLTRIARYMRKMSKGAATAGHANGFDGIDVVVVWKRPDLAKFVGGGKEAPAAMEQPALETIAPCLAVCPREIEKIELDVLRPSGTEWKAVNLLLAAGIGEPPTLSVHLDPLQHHGLTGWTQVGNPPVGWFDDAKIDKADEENCVEAVREAVAHACGPPALLVMPELAATQKVREALSDALSDAIEKRRKPPVLSVIGLYHTPAPNGAVAPALRGATAQASHVNEAIVLGPRGNELWRQQKLSKAYGKSSSSSAASVPEDIVVGRKLTIVPTLVGVITVAICLDSFQARSRERLAHSGADVILVPSLSPSVLRHRTSLGHLVQVLWAAAFVTNRGLPNGRRERSLWNGHSARSFWAFQRRSVTVPPAWKRPDHPSFVFRP